MASQGFDAPDAEDTNERRENDLLCESTAQIVAAAIMTNKTDHKSLL